MDSKFSNSLKGDIIPMGSHRIYTDEQYVRYLESFSLWKDADPEIAEVDDARERLTGLKENALILDFNAVQQFS
jgi:hypothetical protein